MMPIKTLVLLSLMVFSNSAFADTNWGRVTANSLLVVDWLQTREISRNDNYYELNPILGESPSGSDVDRYFILSILTINVIGEMLPEEYSDMFYIAVSTMQGLTVLHNYSVGVRIKF